MEMAPAREHPTIRWGFLDTATLLYGLGMDGEWKYHEFFEEESGSESLQPRSYIALRIWQH